MEPLLGKSLYTYGDTGSGCPWLGLALGLGQARQQLIDNVASLKRSHDAAIHLARLLPSGGRAAKLRRSVSHLGEVLVLGARIAD